MPLTSIVCGRMMLSVSRSEGRTLCKPDRITRRWATQCLSLWVGILAMLGALGLLAPGARAADIPLVSSDLAENADGRLEVFGVGTDGSLYQRWQQSTSSGSRWTPWRRMVSGKITKVRAARFASGALMSAYLQEGRIFVRAQEAPNGGWQASAELPGQNFADLVIARNQDGRLEVIGLQSDGSVVTFPQDGNSSNWQRPIRLSSLRALGRLRALSATTDGEGRLTVVGIARSDGALHTISQRTANGGWGTWRSLGGHDFDKITAATDSAGSLHAFTVGGDQRPYIISKPRAGAWTAWSSFGSTPEQMWTIEALAVGGRIQVLATTAGHAVFRRYQAFGVRYGWMPDAGWQMVDGTPGVAANVVLAPTTRGAALLAHHKGGSVHLRDPLSATTWFDLGRPPEATPPDFLVQLPACLEGDDLGSLDPQMLGARVLAGLRGSAIGEGVTSVDALSLCDKGRPGHPARIGLWLNRSASEEGLQGPPDADNPGITIFIFGSAFDTLIKSLLPRLPNRFSLEGDRIEPQRDGPLRVDSASLAYGDGAPTCGAVPWAEMRLALQGAMRALTFEVPFTADAVMSMCVDSNEERILCRSSVDVHGSRIDALTGVAAAFLPLPLKAAGVGFVGEIVETAQSRSAAVLDKCEIATIFTDRIPMPKKPDEVAKDLLIHMSRIDPIKGPPDGPGGFVISAGVPDSKPRLPPAVSLLTAGVQREVEGAPQYRTVPLQFKTTGLRRPYKVEISSSGRGWFGPSSDTGIDLYYETPVDNSDTQTPVVRLMLRIVDADGLTARSELLLRLAR